MMRTTPKRGAMLPLLLTLMALGSAACSATEPSTGPVATPRSDVTAASAATTIREP